jgi:two-component system chemotaxis response regulator CheB
MAGYDIIVIGASAGGVNALRRIAADLPADLPAAVFMVLHVPAQGRNYLPQIITRSGPLEALHPTDGMAIEQQHIYIAPPDYHMLLELGIIRIMRGPKEHRNRPSIDPLFRSAAQVYGTRTIGVILTGTLDDGALGLATIQQQGGMTIVQDPKDALYASMPMSAQALVHVDYVLPLKEIGFVLEMLVRQSRFLPPLSSNE